MSTELVKPQSYSSDDFKSSEKYFRANRAAARDYARARFSELLTETFGGDCRQQTAQRAAAALNVTERMVLYWLKGQSSPTLEHVIIVGTFCGIDKLVSRFTSGKDRQEIQNLFKA